jgi:hypothetical protein
MKPEKKQRKHVRGGPQYETYTWLMAHKEITYLRFHCTDDHDVMIIVDDGFVGLCRHCCVGGGK